MKATAFSLLASLLLSGCTRRQVNDVSLLDYRHGDGVPEIAGKTVVNLPGWIGVGAGYLLGGALYVGVVGGIEYLRSQQAAQSGR
jgi:hypothetical protein